MIGTMRGALWVPHWPVAAAVSSALAAPEEPVAVCDRRVAALSPSARSSGVRIGDTRRRARYLCPNIRLLDRDREREERVFGVVLDAVEEHVASCVIVRPGLITFGAHAPARAAGGFDRLAERLMESVAEQAEESHVGAGCGLLAAVLAAQDRRVVPAAETADFLAPYPLTALYEVAGSEAMREEWREVIDTLITLGISRLGDLAALDHSLIASRFGTTGSILLSLALGADHAVRYTNAPRGEITVRTATEGASRAEQAAFYAKRLADDLAGELSRRMQVCGQLTVTAQFSTGQRQRTWSMDGAATSRDITDRVRWQISGWLDERAVRPLGELDYLELTADDLSPAGSNQSSLFGSSRRHEEQARRSVLRLQSMLGEDRVCSPRLTGGRFPAGATRLEAWNPRQAQVAERPWPGAIPQPWPAIVFPDPVPIDLRCQCGGELEVTGQVQLSCAGCSEPRPALLSVQPATGRPDPSRAHALCRYAGATEVWSHAGPWQVSGRWWDPETSYRRAYLQLGSLPGALVFRGEGRWMLEGIYE